MLICLLMFPYSIVGNDVGNVEQELDIMQLDYVTRVNRGHARLEDYYNHIIGLLSEQSAHAQVITVARLALSDLLGVSVLVFSAVCSCLFPARAD